MASNIESKLDSNISKVSKRHFEKQKCLTIINLYVIVKALKWAQSFSLCVKSCQSYQLSNPQKLFFKYSAISETWELWNLSYVIPIPLQYPSHPRWLKGLWELVLMYAGLTWKEPRHCTGLLRLVPWTVVTCWLVLGLRLLPRTVWEGPRQSLQRSWDRLISWPTFPHFKKHELFVF